MGMAGLTFDPHPPNFENKYNFWRFSNDAKMIFWFLYWFQIFKNQYGSILSIICSCPCQNLHCKPIPCVVILPCNDPVKITGY